ncbi:uroporphyrin-III C-methyltransferase [Collariella sp. IMI 366227]|nr:uroporphyrin-III C-methyltransferase [Collariella sp. IMI 366227]
MTSTRHQTSLLTAQHCVGHVHLIFGDNPLAAARASSSLSAGARPILIIPSPSSSEQQPQTPLHQSLTTLLTTSSLTQLTRPFTPSDLFTLGRPETQNVVDAVFITSPTSCFTTPTLPGEGGTGLEEAARLSALCKKHRIPVNVVDCPELCTFSLLSVHVDGPLQVGVTTNGRGGSDDSVDQSAELNKLVLEGDKEASKTRRMRWLAQVCEYWPLRRLAEVTEGDVEGILKSYPGATKDDVGGPKTPNGTPLGRVILAGSGPGHPDLLTRATYKAIQTADLILADKLVPAGVLDLVPRRTPVSIARKFPGNADRAQEELLEQALDGVRAGKTVLRLKQGDPFIYGRGGEEVAFFRERGMGDRVVVLPGITSSLSAPLFAGIPPTQRDVADQVLVCTGTGKKGKAPQPPEFVGSRTVVFLMALHRIGGLVAELSAYTSEEEQGREEEDALAA